MGIFQKGEHLPSGTTNAGGAQRYKIRITTEDGGTLYWHKRGQLHVVDEDVARIFVANFKPELFQVLPDGHMTPPDPGKTLVITRVDMEPA
jgi:hypothetical protein